MLIYVVLLISSAIELNNYLKKNSFVNYNTILSVPFSPKISVIAPAYNESITIVENVRSLLSLFYHNFEVIVVNDGSRDSTLQLVIEEFELEKVNYHINYKINCKEIRGIYKSKIKTLTKLIVIDKENGGKADALNAGINIASGKLYVGIDVDSILESDALLKLVKPFLEETDKKVIAAGGAIQVVNSCQVEDGRITEVNLPKKFIPRAQVLEYTRAFLLGRMAWSKLNSILLVSGALGMFDVKTVINCGGYKTDTVGEDMELIVRMRRYMVENNMKYQVKYIPDPLCWTEVPTELGTLGRQRRRWTRGGVDTLIRHRKLFLNPKYGNFGLLGYTYWVFFEWFAPILELLGIIYTIVLFSLGLLDLKFFLLLMTFVYTFALTISVYAILFEELTYHRYEKRRHLIHLLITALFEPVFYHPLVFFWAIRGNIEFFRGKKGWGQIIRKGFNKTAN